MMLSALLMSVFTLSWVLFLSWCLELIPHNSSLTLYSLPSADGAPSSCSAEQQIASLADMSTDQSAVRQTTKLVDMMDSSVPGTNIANCNSTVKSMRRGWSCQGGNFAPRVIVPCPQDFILGTGKKNRLNNDDLDVLQWTQGCNAILEKEDNPAIIKAMLVTLRNTLPDAHFHGFEAARFSYGSMLSLMENGTLHWLDTQNIAEERRSALIARGGGGGAHSQSVVSGY
jgi:hypothetical protein